MLSDLVLGYRRALREYQAARLAHDGVRDVREREVILHMKVIAGKALSEARAALEKELLSV